MSSEKEQEYFSDGLAEELLNVLSKVPELRVAARTSSFYFKGKDAKLPDIARELQVAYLLEGSVRKSGDRVRITTQLIRASDGYHQWSETYDRTLADIFAVQEEIAGAVVSELKATLLGAAPKVHKTVPEAYDSYLQAKQLERQGTARSEEAIDLYQKTLAIDPGFAPAWLWLGAHFAGQADLGLRPLDAGMKLARETIQKALAIDPNFAAAHAALGWVAMNYDHDLAAAARHLEHALALDPADPVALGTGRMLNRALNRMNKGVELSEYLVSRDPMDPGGHRDLAFNYLYAGRLDDAIASYRAVLRLAPSAHTVHASIGDVLLLKGQYEAALAEYKDEPFEPARLGGLASAYYSLGQKRASDAALEEMIDKYPNWAGSIAMTFAYRDEIDRAFEWLYKAADLRESTLAGVPSDIWLKNLHDDPRWLPFLRKIGKAPEQLAAIKFELKVPTH
jgi:TolB-like protein/Tfp pilus assembly protein PilF